MKTERYFILLILVIPVLLLRDFTPNNELKYLSIADEALQNGHFFTFYNHGALYADKPPLYFWLLMSSKYIWGEYSMFILSLFSIIPALVSISVMNKWVREETTSRSRWTASLMLYTSVLFIGSGLVLRMDMLMCMFILLALYTFYKLYANKGRPVDRYLLPFYIFMAVFSKGPVGMVVPFLSIVTFLVVKKETRQLGRYLGWRTWGVLLGLCAVWFGCVYAEGGGSYLHDLVFNQTVNRAIDSFDHKKAFWYYGVTFWYSVAPWSLLYLATIVIAIRKKLITTDKEKLFLSAIGSTFVILSMFSAKLDIYMLPLFPFLAYVTILLLAKVEERWVAFTIYVPVVAFTIAPVIALFLGDKIELPDSIFIFTSLGALFVFSLCALVFLYRGNLYKAINCTALGILVTLFAGAFTLPQLNPSIGFSAMAKKAHDICVEEHIEKFYYYRFRSGENMDVYLHAKPTKIESEDSLFNTHDRGNSMIFLKEKDILRSKKLVTWLKQVHYEKVGIFYLVHPRAVQSARHSFSDTSTDFGHKLTIPWTAPRSEPDHADRAHTTR